MRRPGLETECVLRLRRTSSSVHTSKCFAPESRTPTDRYMGLDAHASSCTLAVVGPSEKRRQIASITLALWRKLSSVEDRRGRRWHRLGSRHSDVNPA
jgi:hypothetical protein